MKEYEIIQEPSGKFSIIYYTNNESVKEFYSYSDGSNKQEIRSGYIEKSK